MTSQEKEQEKLDEEYFAALRELFNTKGWQEFTKECQAQAQELNSVEHTKDLNDLWYRKGQLAVLSNIINLPLTTLVVSADESPE